MNSCILTVELVPRTCWFSNVRSSVSSRDWDTIRKEAYAKANHRCEICFGIGRKHPVECHEVWHYDDKLFLQKLVRMIALCPSCHEVKHIGLAKVRGRLDAAQKHLMKVNNWSKKETEEHIIGAFEQWHERSKHPWKIDLSWLDSKGISYKDDGKR